MRGLSQELVRSGHPAAGVSVYGRGRRLFRFDFGHVDSRYNFALFVSQTQTERVLREALEKTGVAIERGVELVGFTQDELARTPSPSPVSLVLRHPDGRLEEARTPWLVDAEGAHSVVRTTLALPFEGRTFEQTYALGDVRVETSLSEGDYHLFSSQDGFLGLFPLGHAPPSSEAERERFTAVLGRAGGVVLVRPDGYVGFVGGKHATGRHLAAYCRRWLTMHLAPVSGAAA